MTIHSQVQAAWYLGCLNTHFWICKSLSVGLRKKDSYSAIPYFVHTGPLDGVWVVLVITAEQFFGYNSKVEALGNRRRYKDKGSGSISLTIVRQRLGPDHSLKA